MIDSTVRPASRGLGKPRAFRPAVEGLEGRALLSTTTGNRFVHGSRITWSIVPDGTNLGGSSNLVSNFNNRFGPGNWQQSLKEAFAIWENVANVNFVQVGDDGSAIDSGAYQQGSPAFGDIRIGGFALGSGTLAYALLPPAANGGSDAGDIVLNTSQPWQIGGDYDLESVLLHEIGHSLGLGHSDDPDAVMYATYQSTHQYLDPDDVAGVRSIWGPRQPDGFTIGNANYTWPHAVDVSAFPNPVNQIVLGPLNVVSSAESYWFKVTTPANANSTFSVVVQSTFLSELSPKLQIYNASIQGLSQVAASNTSYGAIIGTSIFNSTPNTTYYIKVAGSNAGPNGTGRYALLINMGSYAPPLLNPPNTQVAAQADQGGGSSPQARGILDGPGLAGLEGGHLGHRGHEHEGEPARFPIGDSRARGDSYSVAEGGEDAPAARVEPAFLDFLPIESIAPPKAPRAAPPRWNPVATFIGRAYPHGPA